MEFCALASGSSGNCIYVGHENTAILVDAGISGKKIAEGLNAIGRDPAELKAVLVTHDHSDHIQGAAVLAKRYGIPVYGTRGTLGYIIKSSRCAVNPGLLREIRPDTEFDIDGISIHPFRISHDAIDPVSYVLRAGGRKLGMATDLGMFDDYTVNNLADSDALYLEANHDVNMLMLGSYPYSLKVRINSERGHLSNEACGELVTKLRHNGLKAVVLAHVSKENNFEELAYETVKLALDSDSRFSECPELLVAKRYEPTKLIRL